LKRKITPFCAAVIKGGTVTSNRDRDRKRWDFDDIDQEIEITREADIRARIHQGGRSPPNLNVGRAVVHETEDPRRANDTSDAIHDGGEVRKFSHAENGGSGLVGGWTWWRSRIQWKFEWSGW
jgi:hypothetical protein